MTTKEPTPQEVAGSRAEIQRVPCEQCSAEAGKRCKTPSGGGLAGPHFARREAAYAARQGGPVSATAASGGAL
jgi:hypothetical protein